MDTGKLNILSTLSADILDKSEQNTLLNAFRIAVNGSLTQFNMVDGIVDEYEDESGIVYLATPFAHYKCNDNLATTNVIDTGTGLNHGTGNVNTSNYSVTGKINQAFELNGTTEYINIDALEVDIDSDTTGSISLWINSDDVTTSMMAFTIADTSTTTYFQLGIVGTSNKLIVNFIKSGTQQWVGYSTNTLVNNTWYHIVLVQDGVSPKLYLNGNEEINLTTTTDTTYWFADETANLDNGRIGCRNATGGGNSIFWNGKLDDVRYYKNKALTQAEINAIYNSGNGTEDSTFFSQNISYNSTDDYYSPSKETDTKLLLHLNGADQATATTDDSESAHSITFNGTAQLDTAQKKFGTASLLLDGNSDYLTIPDSDDWTFGSGDFTIDCWIYQTSAGAYRPIFVMSDALDGNQHLISFYLGDSGSQIAGYIKKATVVEATFQSTTGIISTGTWQHVALVRNGDNLTIYVNGTSVASHTFTTGYIMPDCSTGVEIGRNAVTSFPRYWYGNIDEYRISKGIARWTSNFTPPTKEHSTSESMTLISDSFTAEAQPDTARIVLLEEDVDAIILNTDLKVYVTRDNGSNYSQITLVDIGNYDTNGRILSGEVDISGQLSGTSMKYKIETLNNKDLKIHGFGELWD